MDPSTVSRRVRALERAVGARVFDRGSSGHVLIAVGRRLLEAAEGIEADVAAMEREAEGADQRLEGVVRIATSDALGRHRRCMEMHSLCGAPRQGATTLALQESHSAPARIQSPPWT